MATKNEEIVTALQQLVPFGRVQWGLTYVVPAALRDDIIEALTHPSQDMQQATPNEAKERMKETGSLSAEADKPKRGRPPKASTIQAAEGLQVGDTIRGKEPE